MIDPIAFFPQDTPVAALPNWKAPRLLFPVGSPRQQWRATSLYPAFRQSGVAYKLVLRIMATAGCTRTRLAPGKWLLEDLIDESFPGCASLSVLVGTPGPAQKITVELRDPYQRVMAYLKCAERLPALRRLRRERDVLTAIPAGMGPAVLGYLSLGTMEVLITEPIQGKAPGSTLPVPMPALHLGERMVIPHPLYPLDQHPWVRQLGGAFVRPVERWMDALSSCSWPVAVQHGDFAPWNIRCSLQGPGIAIDWEYGFAEGFPYLDVAYYVLQVGALIYRWSPGKAAGAAANVLIRSLGLSEPQAKALVGLASYVSYQEALKDEHTDQNFLQMWRRAVWEGDWWKD